MDAALLELSGAQTQGNTKYTALYTSKFIGGLQSQRSPFASVDTRYNTRFLGGKPDALIAGSNIEVSNKNIPQRRPGLLAYGTASIPPPIAFYEWQSAAPPNIQLIIDTANTVYNYSPSAAGAIFNKAAGAGQTNFFSLADTMYAGDGIDLYKDTGPNLLKQSNNFSNAAWTLSDATLVGGQADPFNGTTATQVTWTVASASAFIRQASIVPNYTPIASNTFTFSIYMKASAAMTVQIEIHDSGGNSSITTANLTTSYQRFQVKDTVSNTATSVFVQIFNPSTTAQTTTIYGAQLEIGGPASAYQGTTIKPEGVWLWGIQAPATAPKLTINTVGSGSGLNTLPPAWIPSHAYTNSNGAFVLTSVAAGTGVYTGTITGGGANAYSGKNFLIQGFSNSQNNGVFACTASTVTTLTLSNSSSVSESAAATASFQLPLTSVAAGTGVYTGTITRGGSNAYVGYGITIAGFSNASNNGTFLCTASTATTLTLANAATLAETTSATAQVLGYAITDSNGNMETVYYPGTSGTSQPVWSTTPGGLTTDGLQNSVVQTQSTNVALGTASVVMPQNVTASNTLIVVIAVAHPHSISVTDTQSDSFTLLTTSTSNQFKLYVYYCLNAAGGATTVNIANGGTDWTWVGVAEIANLTTTDGSAANATSNSLGGFFNTGSITTTNATDMILTFAEFDNNKNASTSIGSPPVGFVQLVGQQGINAASLFENVAAAVSFVSTVQTINPQWTITSPGGGGDSIGITGAFKTSVGTLVWQNQGPVGLTTGTTATSNEYQYYYAFENSVTGHISNVSPISAPTGVLAGQSVTVSGVGMQITPSGPANQDPQVDTIVIYRNTNGGAFWFQLATLPNPGTTSSAGTWSYTDTQPDSALNTLLYAPIGGLNTPPPAGGIAPEFHASRLWLAVGNLLYYATGPDNALVLNVIQNGVSAESWLPSNVIPFNEQIIRLLSTPIGLFVFTTADTWLVVGSNLSSFQPIKIFPGHGLRSYNAIAIDGSSYMMFTSDRECLIINPSAGSIEPGFPIGDLLEATYVPSNVYIARHISGSQDNAFYLADGATGWFRLNPNQIGASVSGEQTPVWSPFATITNGCGAIGSIETSPGIHQLLVGQTVTGPVLVRSLTTFTDNGTTYPWSATIGSIVLATPGKLAEVESIVVAMNNASATQCSVGVLLDEISGTFENIPISVNDPPQLKASTSVLAQRFQLLTGTLCPVVQHMQIQLSGIAAATKDEILATTILGALCPEQT